MVQVSFLLFDPYIAALKISLKSLNDLKLSTILAMLVILTRLRSTKVFSLLSFMETSRCNRGFH